MDTNQLAINSIRVLSAEAIEKANSGHPGLPLGSAPIGYTLFANFLKFNPKNPSFDNRDRFILSAGHGSMLNYSLLHIFGYDLAMEDLKNFRQFRSKTPGHPEHGVTCGVETSTGPLGQGVANAVGMAIAETHLASIFNTDGFNIVDHYTYALTGDGCMQEGIEYEAASLAGTLKLGKLIVFYDKNDITIEGDISTAFSEDVGKRHEAQGWQVLYVKDANNIKSIEKAIKKAQAEKNKPSLIICKTIIGYGSPKQGTEAVHGSPLGKDGLNELKANLEWTNEPFTIPQEVEKLKKKYIQKGAKLQKEWEALFEKYEKKFPALAEKYKLYMSGKMPNLMDKQELFDFGKPDATRNTNNRVLNLIAEYVPNLMGGSADLGPSNKSVMKNRGYFAPTNRTGTNIHFGIREHAMSAICNGIALHGGLRIYCSTFFVFSDYMKNAMRLSALMNLDVTYVLTHDSIGVGEDGPTHQPVEQLVGLRNIPNMKVYRPADGKETAYAWISSFQEKGPSCFVLTRQNLPQLASNENALKGGYVLSDTDGAPDIILMASGSEVSLILQAKEELAKNNIRARVVSMPCLELFERQSQEYKDSVLPKNVRTRLAVEMASPTSWYKYVGLDGDVIGMTTFGESAPFEVLAEEFGFTKENVVSKAISLLNKN